MDELLITLFQNLGYAGALGMFVFFVLRPLTKAWVSRLNGHTTNGRFTVNQVETMGKTMEAQLEKIKNNDFHEVNDKLDKIISLLQKMEYQKEEAHKKINALYEEHLKNK